MLGTCGAQSEFRECRGGEELKETAQSYQKFDQNDRRRTRGVNGRGACDGLVREAMSRVDRDPDGTTPDVPAAVGRILTEADSHSAASRAMFDRIDRFQDPLTDFRLGGYSQSAGALYTEMPDRDQRIEALTNRIHESLQPGDMAHVRLGIVSPVDRGWQGGHAILLQRRARGDYAIFDPNNGAFVYRNESDMMHALRGYLDSAFREAGLQAEPDSITIYSRPRPGMRAGAAPTLPPEVAPRPGPPATLFRHGLYADSATAANGLSQGVLSAAAGRPDALADAASGMSVAALQSVASGHTPDLASATGDLRERLRNPQTSEAALDEIRTLDAANRYSTLANLPDHIRHEGQSPIQNTAQLVEDLARHFGTPYSRDDSQRGYDDDLAEIRLKLHGHVRGEAGARAADQAADQAGEPPVVIQRLNHSDNYRSDAYQIYDPIVGVYSYRNFDDMSFAIASRYERAFAQGDADYATTSWFANLNRSRPVRGAGEAEFAIEAGSPINGVMLADIAEARHVAVPPIALPPEPDMERPTLARDETRKRAAEAQPVPAPLPHSVVFRPSTMTPEAVKAHGGFSIEGTALKDVSLDMHDFDVSSNPAVVDSAGYLGTFQSGKTALERLASQSANGYIYRVAPTPNMVDVDASLGAHTRNPENHEQAAMGRIDFTQIVGWQEVRDGKLQPFVANPDYRWDIYDQTQTAGAQPQLARYPVDSPGWNDKTHRPFMSRVSYGGKPAVARPNQDPNRTQAEFYDHARSQVKYLVERQARRLDYRGPVTLWGYGSSGWQTKLYADGHGGVLFDYSHHVDVAGNTSQFIMGDDGRFHLASNNARVLRVDGNGYLYVGAVPSSPTNRNGVFAINGKHLVHAEDGKFLSVSNYSYYPFVSRQDRGSASEWDLTGFDGRAVVPPTVGVHTFWKSPVGDRRQLFEFAQNPDSALPAGTTRFVTQVPGADSRDSFRDYINTWTSRQVSKMSRWLARANAALLFNDGYYAVAIGLNRLEVRKLDGTPVWRVSIDPATRKGRARRLARIEFGYRIPASTMERIKADEGSYRQLQRLLKSHYDLRG